MAESTFVVPPHGDPNVARSPDRTTSEAAVTHAAVRLLSDSPLPCSIQKAPHGRSRFLTQVSGRCLAAHPGELLLRPRGSDIVRLRHRLADASFLRPLVRRKVSVALQHTLYAEGPGSDLRIFDEDQRLCLWALEGPLESSCPIPGFKFRIIHEQERVRLLCTSPRAKASTTQPRTLRVPGSVRAYRISVLSLRPDWVSLVCAPGD